ncbi:CocE/NonD family hydrolase [Cellulomonas sp. KH9]|uniref:CocE/NonD family hydrolase n=1 Tax=Cellulomonas sp. KH9 TaxID=1855324 RepID=UPI0008E435AB|nr:CocE/NonD family hydrolase [Cellulomonas sp. KH9]SFK19500.1 hypothetical protein SAMN05216467_2441 [Cellulomonas sp. KH9]
MSTSPRPSTRTDHDVPVPMRDGTVLRAVVVRPLVDEPVPVVLLRSPYPLADARFETDLMGLAERGLALVMVALRGTGASDGVFYPWADDQRDGVDTIAWCAEQEWSNGRVATTGRSYVAQTQLYAAGGAPPALRAMVTGVVPSDPWSLTYTGGALNLGSTLGWAAAMAGVPLARRAAAGEDVTRLQEEWAALLGGFPAGFATTPLTDVPVLDELFPAWRDWAEHAHLDDYWRAHALPDRPALPTFVVAGWHDVFRDLSLREFAREPRHPGSRLVVGPWSHGPAGRSLGDVDHGPAASGAAIGLDAQILDFLAAHLASDDVPVPDAPVQVFVTGANVWTHHATWPPAARDVDLHLHPGALAAGPAADGTPPSRYVFDPRDPVPTRGGNTLLPQGDAAGMCGSVDQRPLDARTDVLRFVGDPLPAPVRVIGTVRLTLHAATSAADTDWTAKLVDVHPDGTALNLVDGILRASRQDPAHPALLTPDEPHELVVELGAVGHEFAAGHRIRLDVSSSSFPRFDRNPGTGAPAASVAEADFVVAHQRVLHDAAHLSRLTLPVVVAGDQPADDQPAED